MKARHGIAAAATAALALPGAAAAQVPANCVTGGATGDPVQDCYHATGVGETGPFQRFVGEWTAPPAVAIELPGVPPVTCKLFVEEHASRSSVWNVVYVTCDNPVPPSLTFTVVGRNGLLTPTTAYYYAESSNTCTGESSCQAPGITIGGSSGATYRAVGKVTVTAPGLNIGTPPWCVRERPDTISCWASETQLDV